MSSISPIDCCPPWIIISINIVIRTPQIYLIEKACVSYNEQLLLNYGGTINELSSNNDDDTYVFIQFEWASVCMYLKCMRVRVRLLCFNTNY